MLSLKTRDRMEQRYIWLMVNRHLWNHFPDCPEPSIPHNERQFNWRRIYGKQIIQKMQADGLICATTYHMDVNICNMIRDIQYPAGPDCKYLESDDWQEIERMNEASSADHMESVREQCKDRSYAMAYLLEASDDPDPRVFEAAFDDVIAGQMRRS